MKNKLTDLFPLRTKVRKLTSKEKTDWKQFIKDRTVILSIEKINYICELYAKVFSKQVWFPEPNANPKPLIVMIDRLDLVYNNS
ncbi:MAG: hypothetical protein HQ471_07725 [Flavobacteriales bacterium]|nr:hypothetical protein [Flavobacteriales bacterium]